MGFFKFLKKLLYFIPKKTLVIIIIVLLLMCLSTNSFCATNENLTNYDVFNWLQTRQHLACYQLMQSEIGYYNRNATFEPNFVNFCQNVTRVNYDYGFVYTYDMTGYLKKSNGNNVDGGTNPGYVFFGTVLAYNTAQHNSPPAQDYDTYSDYPVNIWTGNTIYRIAYSNGTYPTLSENNVTVSIPSGLENNFPQEFRDFAYQVANSTYNPSTTDEILENIDTKIAQTNQELQTVQSKVQDTNDFLTDDTIDDYTSEDLPQNTVTDITQDGFNSIFTKLYNKMTATGFNSVHIPLNIHGNDMSFDVNSNSFDFYKTNRQLVDFIQLIWSFVIYYYIIQDVYKLINELSQGKFSSYVDNIKTTLL